MKNIGLWLLLIAIVVCGAWLTAKTGKEEYFGYALAATAFIGFWSLMTGAAS